MAIPALGQPGFGMDWKNRFRGAIFNNPQVQNYPTPLSLSTGAQTLTGAQLISGIITGATGTNAQSWGLPTAALLRQALALYCDIQGVQNGDTISTLVVASGTGSIAFTAGSGGSFDTNGNSSVSGGQSKVLLLRFTNATPGSEAYTVYL